MKVDDPYKAIEKIIEATRNSILRVGFRGFYRQAHLQFWCPWGGNNGRLLLSHEATLKAVNIRRGFPWKDLEIVKFKVFGPWDLLLGYLKYHYEYHQGGQHIFKNKENVHVVCFDPSDMVLLGNVSAIEDPYLGELVNQYRDQK